jgi:2-dehydro-3-deoxygluconokinase
MAGLVTFGDTALQLSPRGNARLATARHLRTHAEGIESGAAVAMTALGGESTWVSRLPDSPLARRALGQLRQHGVETEITWADADRTRQGLVFRDPGRQPRPESVRYDYQDTAVASASPGDLPIELIRDAGVALSGVSTAALSEQAESTTLAMLRAAQGSDVGTTMALDYRPGLAPPERYRAAFEALVDHSDLFVASESGAEAVFGATGQPRELAHTIAAEYDLKTVVVTCSDGSVAALRDVPGTNVVHDREGIETETVDTTGREAAFVGALLGRLDDGAELPEALAYGVAASALACTVSGPLLTATPGDIERLVD